MILATILRNFKCYKGINIVPFSRNIESKLNIIIGNNGVGKSAVLEGLNTLFNESSWIVNNESRSHNDSGVGALFLFEKSKIRAMVDSKELAIIEKASNFFWDLDVESNTTYKNYEPLRGIIDSVVDNKSSCYLFIIGRTYSDKKLSFLTFTTSIRNLHEPKPDTITIDRLLDKILQSHSYIYIPVETPVSEFVTLQSKSMQTLMDRNIKQTIADALSDKRITRTKKTKKYSISVLQIINECLEDFVNKVEQDIQQTDKSYSFKPGYRTSSKLTPNHVTDTIINAYYSKRVFKKDGKSIDNLSSGEKRIILIDIISSFLNKNKPDRELIVALDEPENSLHVSKCYDQFARINKIALKYNHQIFVTTHWYGSLPCLDKGGLIHIDDNSHPQYYELTNYFENRGALPNDIQLKGYFDLSSSLLYSFRNSTQSMILVEGSEDKKYIRYYLPNEDLKIIPLGGCSNVKKVYEYLYAPLCSKEMFDGRRDNRIICLIDTDILCTEISMPSDIKSKVLMLRRLQQEDGKEPELLTNEHPKKYPTEVEDVLEPKQYYDTLDTLIMRTGSDIEKEVWSAYDYNENTQTSRIKGDASMLKSNTLGRNIVEDKQVIMRFVDKYKFQIAEEYTTRPRSSITPKWITLLKELSHKY